MRSIQKYWVPRVGVQVLPPGILGILRRTGRVGADVAEAAGHAHPVGPHQVLVVEVALVGVVAISVPGGLGRLVEGRVGEQAQTHDARGVAVIGSQRDVLAPRSDLHARVLRLVLERIRRALRILDPVVEPQTVAVLADAVSLLETRLVDQPEVLPPVVAAVVQARVVRDGLEQVQVAEAQPRKLVPEPVVAGAPDHPVVAAPNRRRDGVRGGDAGQVRVEGGAHGLRLLGHAVVHVAEVVVIGSGKALRCPVRLLGFVQDGPRFGLLVSEATHDDHDGDDHHHQGQDDQEFLHRSPHFLRNPPNGSTAPGVRDRRSRAGDHRVPGSLLTDCP